MSDVPDGLEQALSDRYSIERKLGEGGMATVYLAEDIKHERRVALKVLKPELAAVIGGERFVSEIKTTAGLQHPHILPLFDSGEADGFLYYVMPFVDGETLRQRLDRERQLPVEESIRLVKACADALDYAHRQGVIHRDIKPDNILLQEGNPVVADFGIALAISAAGGGRLTETGLSLGTPHYMSPEQATADRDLTSRSDVVASILERLAEVASVPVGDPGVPAVGVSDIVAHYTGDAQAALSNPTQLKRVAFMLRQVDPEAAIRLADAGVERFPWYDVFQSRGSAHLAAGDTAAALRDFRTSIEMNPDNASLLETLERLTLRATPTTRR